LYQGIKMTIVRNPAAALVVRLVSDCIACLAVAGLAGRGNAQTVLDRLNGSGGSFTYGKEIFTVKDCTYTVGTGSPIDCDGTAAQNAEIVAAGNSRSGTAFEIAPASGSSIYASAPSQEDYNLSFSLSVAPTAASNGISSATNTVSGTSQNPGDATLISFALTGVSPAFPRDRRNSSFLINPEMPPLRIVKAGLVPAIDRSVGSTTVIGDDQTPKMALDSHQATHRVFVALPVLRAKPCEKTNRHGRVHGVRTTPRQTVGHRRSRVQCCWHKKRPGSTRPSIPSALSIWIEVRPDGSGMCSRVKSLAERAELAVRWAGPLVSPPESA
jgi:hypothetical protein